MCCNKAGELIDRREMLKVKAKSLAEEARIIRKEECKAGRLLQDELHLHRIFHVRWHARATYLAYGLVKGKKLEQIEQPTKQPRTEELWKSVKAMVQKYGPVDKAAQTQLLASCTG